MNVVENQSARSGLSLAVLCAALALSRSTFYRRDDQPKQGPRTPSPRALHPVERDEVLATLHSERFLDKAPAEVYAELLDEGRYLCSTRTMYRILEANDEVRERRNQRRHPPHKKPELVAKAPNQIWTWDITKLRGPGSTHYSLYVVLDIFSRYVVGWLLAERESAELATRLLSETSERQKVVSGQVTVHADRGAPMTSDLVAALLARLGITKTHSRPRVSDDNPFSEAQFKTLKYHPWFPERFGSLDDAHTFCQRFFRWYNTEHRHSGIGFVTPYEAHHGLAEATLANRAAVLAAAFAAHPERFPHGLPNPGALPTEVWINQPAMSQSAQPGAGVEPQRGSEGAGASNVHSSVSGTSPLGAMTASQSRPPIAPPSWPIHGAASAVTGSFAGGR